MKIYRRDEFVKLPAGTLFAKGHQWAFDDLCVKGETLSPSDWYFRPLVWIESDGDSDQWSKLDAMLETGSSEPIAAYEQRDGSFDPTDIFLVYEPTDLAALEEVIKRAYQVYTP